MSNFLIYLIFNVTGIKVFFVIFGIISLITLLVIGAHFGDNLFDDKWDEEHKNYVLTPKGKRQKVFYVIFVIISIVLLLLGILLPNKESLIAMQVKNLATIDNYNWTVEQLKGAVDYMVEAINKIGK